ncbi:ABC transporter substrate-binding protein [Mesorhizobium sp.]|uniref:ABC transporter substrate-binding protein n=1 Tax=Mesorhizobium sp. TaxID=1871066 RepID=UPI000FE72A4B|nr:ABC transporter substrate-binding protein [Mesorhizobium sp.]RWA97484.1 MAG: ABC transporter substrate-binding protein [Mesorhizobium sp.]
MSKELEYLSHHVSLGRMSRRDFLGRAAALGVATPFVNSLPSSVAMAEEPVRGGIIKAAIQGGQTTNSLDPAAISSQIPFNFSKVWGEYLVALEPGGLERRLAEEFGSSADAKVWTFKIRNGVEFHNGKTVTAEDVVATLERHSNEQSRSGALGITRGIESIKAQGRDVVVTLKEGNSDLPYLMADYHFIIQPNGGKDDPAAGISAGPYKVAVNQPGTRHVGERFKNFWQPDKMGFADQVEIIVVNDPTAQTSALQGGQVHMINRVEPKIVDLLKHVPGVEIKPVSGPGHVGFIMQCDTAPFDNFDLRMALKLAINREEMADKIQRGYGSVGNDFPINASYPLFTEIEQRPYDPDKAKFHYNKSGHDGTVLLRTANVAFPGAVDAAQLYQQSAAKAGIKLEIKREPGDGYWSEVYLKQPFCATYWSGRPTQDQIYSTFYQSSAQWNETHFFNEKFDKLLTEARAEFDQDKRKNLYHQMALIVRDQSGFIIPMFIPNIDAISDKVGGFGPGINFELMDGYALDKCWLKA